MWETIDISVITNFMFKIKISFLSDTKKNYIIHDFHFNSINDNSYHKGI